MNALPNKTRHLALVSVLLATFALVEPAGAQTIRFVDTDPEEVGTLSPREADLPRGLWQGTTPTRLAAAIAGLPPEIESPAQHRATQRLLSVGAPPPPGEAVDPSLVSLRIGALAQYGAEQAVLALEERVAPAARHAPYWDALATVRMLRFDLAGVCNLSVRAAARVASADWQRLRGFCRWVRGQEEEAIVAVVMSQELGAPDDVFETLFLAQQFPARAHNTPIAPEKPLHIMMQRALGLPLASMKWPETAATIAAGLARFPAAGIEPRTQAAERAVKGNVLSPDLLVQLYLATELTTPLGTAYRQAAFAPTARGRVPALQDFWAKSREVGLYVQLAPFTLGYLSGLDLASVEPDFAGDALRVALVAQDPASVGAWQDALLAASLRPDGARARDASYAVLALAGHSVPPSDIWWPAWRKAAGASARDQAFVAGLLNALGTPVANAKLPAADRSAAGRALAAAPLGEGALLALAALSNPAAPTDGLAVQAVAALARVNGDDARAVALELALARGL